MTINKSISVYEKAVKEFWAAIFHDERRNSGGILNWLGEGEVTRHKGAIRTIQGDNPLDQRFRIVKGTAKIDYNVIRTTDLETYVQEIRNMGKMMVEQESVGLFKSLDEMFSHPDSPAITIDLNNVKQDKND